MFNTVPKKAVKKAIVQKAAPKVELTKYQGKGTRARLNTAAQKIMFGQRSSD